MKYNSIGNYLFINSEILIFISNFSKIESRKRLNLISKLVPIIFNFIRYTHFANGRDDAGENLFSKPSDNGRQKGLHKAITLRLFEPTDGLCTHGKHTH